MLDFLRAKGLIDRKVDQILDTFLKEIEKGSGRKKRRRVLNIGFAITSIIVTPLISNAVNKGDWPTVSGISVLFIIISVAFIILNDN